MDLLDLNRRFSTYLESSWSQDQVAPFGLVYIRLLRMFSEDLTKAEYIAISERENQLRGRDFCGEGFDELRTSLRRSVDKSLSLLDTGERRTVVERLLFCAFLDTQEEDYFYMAEPIFDFARSLSINADQVGSILKEEFSDFEL